MTTNAADTATAPAPAHTKPTPPKRRWRATTARKAERPAAIDCEVERLAVEAANVLQTSDMLSERPEGDRDLVGLLESLLDGPWPRDLREGLSDRLAAIENMATHRAAKSVKGALFQLYLSTSQTADPRGNISQKLAPADQLRLDKIERSATRLQHSAITHLETLAWDQDLACLRAWYFHRRWDIRARCDLAIENPAKLRADAQAQAVREAAHRV